LVAPAADLAPQVPPSTEEELEDLLSTPGRALVEDLGRLRGDIMILGAGGKMGPSLAKLARRAADLADGARHGRDIFAVSRFTSGGLPGELHAAGVETVSCDLLDAGAVDALPNAPNVVFMAGRKFGSTGGEALTWAMNAYMPALIARRFKNSQLAVFSSGNVYPFVPVGAGGASEDTAPAPLGEYAQSVLARERIFEHFSLQWGTPVTILRLNYAIDLRYGVLLDVAQRVRAGQPVDVTMGHVNVIWQGDANALALRSLAVAASPPAILNLTGPETISVRWLAGQFGRRFGVEPVIEGLEAETALLNNAARCHARFGYPLVSLLQMVDWVAHWVETGGPTLDKPTHFQEREGKF
jgi:nucleoside-diphosphate-sugar epimerase